MAFSKRSLVERDPRYQEWVDLRIHYPHQRRAHKPNKSAFFPDTAPGHPLQQHSKVQQSPEKAQSHGAATSTASFAKKRFEEQPKTHLGIHTNFVLHDSYLTPSVSGSTRKVGLSFIEKPADADGQWFRIYETRFENFRQLPCRSRTTPLDESVPTRDPNQMIYRVDSLYQLVVREEGQKAGFQIDGSTIIKLWSEDRIKRGALPKTMTLHLGENVSDAGEETQLYVYFN